MQNLNGSTKQVEYATAIRPQIIRNLDAALSEIDKMIAAQSVKVAGRPDADAIIAAMADARDQYIAARDTTAAAWWIDAQSKGAMSIFRTILAGQPAFVAARAAYAAANK